MRLLLRCPCLCTCPLHLGCYAAIYRSVVSIFGMFVLVLICLAGAFIASVLAVARPMCKVLPVVQDVRAVLIRLLRALHTLLVFWCPTAKAPPAQPAACTAWHAYSPSASQVTVLVPGY